MANIQLTRRTFLSAAGAAAVSPAAASRLFVPGALPEEADIIIVGSGAAGITAAIAAKEAGGREVLVLEQLPFPGGSTRLSGGYLNAVDPKRQKPQGISDSIEKHIEQTRLSGRFRGEAALIKTLCEGAPLILQWLEEHGISYLPDCVQTYGGLFPRAHIPDLPPGTDHYIDILISRALEASIQICTNCRMTEILTENGGASGVKVLLNDEHMRSIRANKAVILAAGGYSANRELCSFFDPRLKDLDTTNLPGSTGEAMLAAQKIGAFLTGCDFIECIPLHVRFSRFAILVEHCIFVDLAGKRFIREDDVRDVLRDKVLSLPNRMGYIIVDQKGYEKCPSMFRKEIEEGLRQKEIFTADTLEDLARQLRLPVSAFLNTVRRYNEFVEKGEDLDFKRDPQSLLYSIKEPPFWASKCEMSVHHTMGGVRINSKAQVLDWDGSPIPRLYAAGEVTGGIHGANRLGGNAITDAHLFGKIAGENAAREE